MDETLNLILIVLGLATFTEIILYAINPVWRHLRIPFAAVALAFNGFALGSLIFYSLSPLMIVAGLAAIYRIFNLLRVVRARLHEVRLKQTAARTFFALASAQIFFILIWSALPAADIKLETALIGIAITQLGLATGLFYATVKNLITSRPPKRTTDLSDRELPTLTVAIPARNETTDLSAGLEDLLKCDYPKLEIVVYDDCSQEVTANVVKEFAHRGVRFIGATTLKPNWLAKNQAYDKLYKQASGSIILFCGVDTRFEAQSLRRIVTILKEHDLLMLSILPRRALLGFAGMIIQSIRYWWELALPRWLFRQPPVLSTCWVIEKSELKRLGGFEAVAQTIRPENYFARQTNTVSSYSFYRSANWLGISSAKSVDGQKQTALRTRYPQLKKRPETVAFLSLTELVLLLGTLFVIPAALKTGAVLALIIAGCALVLLFAAQSLILFAANPSIWWQGVIGLPVAILADIILANYSMWKYEFSDVIWKGRNICLPVLRAIPSLPLSTEVRSRNKE